MKTSVTLESNELRAIVAMALGIPEKQVIQQRYSIAIEGLTAEEISARMAKLASNAQTAP